MAPADLSLAELLGKLTTSLESASDAVPEKDSILPPADGISLLDVKNEFFLSYLQNLTFLILLKIRNRSPSETSERHDELDDAVVKKLVALRVYLDKGVRPLESKLKFQIDKVVRTADEAARLDAQKATGTTRRGKGAATAEGEPGDDDSEDDDDEEDTTNYRPNAAVFSKAAATRQQAKPRDTATQSDGIYRPPRINPTALPTTDAEAGSRTRRPQRSAVLDSYIASELSGAPTAEVSIGADIVSGGRRTKTAKERQQEDERTRYEEENFVRLPGVSKKERAKQQGRREQGWGGEDLRGLSSGLDRIEGLVRKRGAGASGGGGGGGGGSSAGGGKRRKR